MKKILIASDFYDTNIGGVEIFIRNLERIFDGGGFEVKKLLTSNTEPLASDKIILKYKKAINIASKSSRFQRNFRKYFAVKEIKKILQNYQPDVIIACKLNTLYLFNEALKNDTKTVLIGSLHVHFASELPKRKINFSDFLQRVNALCVLNNDDFDFYNQFIKNVKIAPNPNLLPVKEISKENIILYASRIERPQKRADIFINACALIADKINDYKIIIAGDGKHFQESLQLAKSLNLRAEFLGQVSQDEIFSLYARAKISVLSSSFEGFPYALVEPMNYECARISTRYKGGSLEKLIDDGVDGLIAELDEKDLAQKILFLAQNEEKREQICIKAKDKFEKITKNANNFYVDLVKELCDE